MFAARPGLCTSLCTTLGSAADYAPVGGTIKRTAAVRRRSRARRRTARHYIQPRSSAQPFAYAHVSECTISLRSARMPRGVGEVDIFASRRYLLFALYLYISRALVQ